MYSAKVQPKVIINANHEALLGVGVHLSDEIEKQRIAAKWGSGHREEIIELLQEHPELVDDACRLYEEHLFGDTFVDCLSILPGTQEFLERLSKKYKLAVASGVHPQLLKDRVMKKFNIPNVFCQIITAYDLDDVSKAKPHTYIAQEIMRTQGISQDETIMVGDARNDVMMARNAGIEPVVVLTGHLSRLEAEELSVENIIEDVTKLETVLEKLS